MFRTTKQVQLIWLYQWEKNNTHVCARAFLCMRAHTHSHGVAWPGARTYLLRCPYRRTRRPFPRKGRRDAYMSSTTPIDRYPRVSHHRSSVGDSTVCHALNGHLSPSSAWLCTLCWPYRRLCNDYRRRRRRRFNNDLLCAVFAFITNEWGRILE